MYRKKREGWTKHLDFILLDILYLQIAFTLAHMLRFGAEIPYAQSAYRSLAIVYILVDFMVSVSFNSFKNVLRRGKYKEFVAAAKHVMLVGGVTLLYLFSTQRSEDYSRLSFFIMIPIYLVLTYIGRLLWKRRFRNGSFYGGGRSMVILAPYASMAECIKHVTTEDYSPYGSITAVVTDRDCKGRKISGVEVAANYDEVAGYVCREWVDEIFISKDAKPDPDLIEQLMLMGVAVHAPIACTDSADSSGQYLERIGDYAVLTSGVRLATDTELALKRAMDIAGGLAGCMAALTIIIVFGPMIYLSSPGPIIFSQERVGRNGKKFRLYKLRTMYPDAEERKRELMEQNRIESGMMFKLDYDPRIIGNRIAADGTIKEGLGSFLRRTSLDEFPQFFNVLRGDMSLVGTRPPTVDEWEQYKPHHRARLSFRPGITGLWQVSGRSNIIDFEEVVRLDTEYIDKWSISDDIKILGRTVGVVLGNSGAM